MSYWGEGVNSMILIVWAQIFQAARSTGKLHVFVESLHVATGKTCFQLGNHSNFMLVDQRKGGLKHFWPGDDILHCVLGHDGWMTPPDLSTYTLDFLAALAGRASFWPWMNTSRPCRCQRGSAPNRPPSSRYHGIMGLLRPLVQDAVF